MDTVCRKFDVDGDISAVGNKLHCCIAVENCVI